MSPAAVLLTFLLLPPILQLLALLVAIRQGVPDRTLMVAALVVAGALVGAGVAMDVGQGAGAGDSAFPVPDWAVGCLLGVAIVLETAIVVSLHSVGTHPGSQNAGKPPGQ